MRGATRLARRLGAERFDMGTPEPTWSATPKEAARPGVLASASHTLLDGLMVVVPLGAVVLLVHGILDRLQHAADPLAGHYLHPFVAAAGMFLLLCLLVGALAQSGAGRAARDWLDVIVFDRIPGYRLAKAFLADGTQPENADTAAMRPEPALARIEEGLCPAFILDRFADGRLVVFVPSTPAVMTGAIYIFTPDRVVPLDVPLMPFQRSVVSWGLGLRRLMEAAARDGAAEDPARQDDALTAVRTTPP